ncbi:MAG TPA: molybdopterin cofactor-binding domain-containing protein [Thermoanaerobaculia bacterium]|nr:molybdopterin cofactor-binding domain-containing protein [Thermoanaerobaculia bacterium]
MSSTRRDFLRITAIGGAALMLGIETRAQDVKQPWRANVWMRLDPDGSVTLFCGKQEMGQGVRTSLPMILADELDADWANVRIEQAQPGPDYPRLGTGGSGSVYGAWRALRPLAAAARMMLVTAAAARLGVDAATLRTENSFVIHDASKRRLAYGELTEAASKLDVPKEPRLKSTKEFRLIGKRIPATDLPKILTGTAKYGLDARVPGMKFATVLRCPVVGGSVKSFDASKAKDVQAVQLSTGIALVAKNTWTAMKARPFVDVEWDLGPHASFDSNAWIEGAIEASKTEKGDAMRAVGVVPAEGTPFDATYVYPFYSHAQLEPMNCTAHVAGDHCTVWAPTQAPNTVQNDVAALLKIAPANVVVHPMLMGGGFGRRLRPYDAVEAAELSKAIGAPVQIVWTREEDFTDARLQHAAVEAMHGVVANGRIVSWAHKKVCSPFMTGRTPSADDLNDRGKLFRGLSWGAYDVPYDVPHIDVRYVRHDSPVRYGPWRAVFAPASVFARECFFDELAHAAGKDPLLFRLEHLSGDGKVDAGDLAFERARLRRVLEVVRERSGWNKPLPAGRARGVACNIFDGDTHIAYVVEVTAKENDWRVDRVVCAVDCGAVVNPIGVEQQIEGGVVWALSQLLAQITLKNGRVEQTSYADFPIPTIANSPRVETHIVGSDAPEAFGMGEPPVPPLVPAVLNAIFAATGQRHRRLPI